MFDLMNRPNFLVYRRLTLIFFALYDIWLFERFFVKQCFARFNASCPKGVVVFYSAWCIIVWYKFLQIFGNFTNLFKFSDSNV